MTWPSSTDLQKNRIKCFVLMISVPHATSNFVYSKMILHNRSHVRVYSPFFFQICLNSKSENGFSVLPLLEITDACWHQNHGNKQIVLLNDKMKPSKFNWNKYVLRRHVKYRSSCNIKNLFGLWTKLATVDLGDKELFGHPKTVP